MSTEQNPVKNRKTITLWIYPRFQKLLIGMNIIVTISIYGMIYFQATCLFDRFRVLGNQIHLPPQHPYFELLNLQSNRLLSGIAVVLCIGLFISSFFMLILSHRLAGPVLRLKSFFSEISQSGKVNYPLKFRKGDFFSELPNHINQALDKLTPK